jgi:hypothetical protein
MVRTSVNALRDGKEIKVPLADNRLITPKDFFRPAQQAFVRLHRDTAASGRAAEDRADGPVNERSRRHRLAVAYTNSRFGSSRM